MSNQVKSKMLENVLSDFGITGAVKNVNKGPLVTTYEFEPSAGTRMASVLSLSNDIALNMNLPSVRISMIPENGTIGVELPNTERETVDLFELFESDKYINTSANLPLALGKDISGNSVVADLSSMPHLLIAGTTGSGKSVTIHSIILSLLNKLTPDECRFIMIDPKMVELPIYNGIKHLLMPVVTEADEALEALNWAVEEMEERYRLMSEAGARNIQAYNNKIKDGSMPYIVIVIEEIADLMSQLKKNFEVALQRLAQKARAAGIHVIVATQRPSVDVITGTIKANFPSRIGLKVASKVDSKVILDEQGAENLLGNGDMLFSAVGKNTIRVHGAYATDEQIEKFINRL